MGSAVRLGAALQDEFARECLLTGKGDLTMRGRIVMLLVLALVVAIGAFAVRPGNAGQRRLSLHEMSTALGRLQLH